MSASIAPLWESSKSPFSSTRIFPTRDFRLATFILGGIVISWVIAIVFVSVFQCTPVEKTWNPAVPGHCINLKGSFIGNAIPNIMTDIAILSLPVRVVWRLHADLTYRLSVIVVFLLGSFVVFTSIYRFSTLFLLQTDDISWTLSTACTWCIIECASGIISACLPTLRPLFVLISHQFNSSIGSIITGGHAQSNNAHAHSSISGTSHETGFPPFRRLSDSAFRPAHERRRNAQIRMEVNKRDRDDEWGSGDELPLNTIRVQRDIKWEATTRVDVDDDVR
ncbi:hypothetical protein VTN77DRAFT_4079 [Rasamsonia byssochlamydoides]|uniref:uncharacterized protein n=1 Tax=Rasamsonia byssochlamydoides TaxID=89139 RepID=UPI003742EA19